MHANFSGKLLTQQIRLRRVVRGSRKGQIQLESCSNQPTGEVFAGRGGELDSDSGAAPSLPSPRQPDWQAGSAARLTVPGSSGKLSPSRTPLPPPSRGPRTPELCWPSGSPWYPGIPSTLGFGPLTFIKENLSIEFLVQYQCSKVLLRLVVVCTVEQCGERQRPGWQRGQHRQGGGVGGPVPSQSRLTDITSHQSLTALSSLSTLTTAQFQENNLTQAAADTSMLEFG